MLTRPLFKISKPETVRASASASYWRQTKKRAESKSYQRAVKRFLSVK